MNYKLHTISKTNRISVDSYESGRRIPSCQLEVQWTKDPPPVVLRQRVTLDGAKHPPNFITVQSDPLPLPLPQGKQILQLMQYIIRYIVYVTLHLKRGVG